MPTVRATAARTPPTPYPALRMAWRKPNQISRSPVRVICVTIGPSALQNPDRVALRTSVGRHRDEADLQRDDADVVDRAVADLGELVGGPLLVLASRVTRWGGALPQYAVGHLARVSSVRAALAGSPGLAVAGAAYDGVGIPACIASGTAAAIAVGTHLDRLARDARG